MIVESYYLAATDSDILAAPSRLASIPYNGTLILEMVAQTFDGTNFFSVTIQLPDGSTPLDAVKISAGTGGSAAILDVDTKYVVSFPVSVGGHVLINAVETGASSFQLRATLMP
jgi:hypothetical protein